jgi:hypothetical protein
LLSSQTLQLQGENKTIITMTAPLIASEEDWSYGGLSWQKDGALTHFSTVQSCADGASDASLYIVCVDKLLKESERRFKDFWVPEIHCVLH